MAGTLSATINAFAPVSASSAFAGSGALDVAAMSPILAMPAALAGSGALTAAMYRTAAIPVALAGAGTLTATDKQKYAPAPALAGSGALTAVIRPQIIFVGRCRMAATSRLPFPHTLSATLSSSPSYPNRPPSRCRQRREPCRLG